MVVCILGFEDDMVGLLNQLAAAWGPTLTAMHRQHYYQTQDDDSHDANHYVDDLERQEEGEDNENYLTVTMLIGKNPGRCFWAEGH